jgi:uncharacterized membrane protein
MTARRDVSRIEGFSDAVFGFAVTLLVVSLEVPKTFDELLAMMRGFPAFAVSFALLFQIWWRHYRFFRKYDLEDGVVIALTGLLLFVVLFYVYPLKFLWSFVFQQLAGRTTVDMLPINRTWELFVIYGVGVAASFAILASLYSHAYHRRRDLALSPIEVADTRVEIYRNLAIAGIAVVSVAIALVAAAYAPRAAGLAGFVYFLIGVSETILGAYNGRLRRQLGAMADPRAEEAGQAG